jgi:glycosyltransferase 2 family protein
MAPARTDSNQVASGLGRKIVLAGLLAAVIWAGLALYGDVRELQRTARTFAPSAFVASLALVAGNYVLRIARWQYYLGRIGVAVPLGQSALIFLAGLVMSVTPGKIGEVFKSLLLYDARGTPIVRSAPIVIAERLTDLIALVVLVSAGSLAFEHGRVVACASAAVVAGLWLVCAYRPLGQALLRGMDRLPGVNRISPRLHQAYDALLELTRPTPLLIGTLIGIGGWSLECVALYAIAHGFAGVALPLDAATFTYAASTLAGAVAMLPGGLGVTEVGMTVLLQTLGGADMRAATATAITMLIRIATLWFGVAVGAVALAILRARGNNGGGSVPDELR